MEVSLPLPVQPLIAAYLKALEPLRPHFYGLYVYGSIALDAFEEQQSDIDLVALTQGEWTASELEQFSAVHTALLQEQPLSKRMDVQYVPLGDLGRRGEPARHPLLRDGAFVLESERGDLNAVTWWMIKHKGIRLLGPEPAALPFEVAWQDVLETMRYNLDGYWAGQAKRPYLFLSDYWVDFAVTTLCRILTTIEDGEIIGKSAALTRWRSRLSERWGLLIDEAWRLRHQPGAGARAEGESADAQRPQAPAAEGAPALYRWPLERAHETLAFLAYARQRGGEALAASAR
jgi:hypothetical protein